MQHLVTLLAAAASALTTASGHAGLGLQLAKLVPDEVVEGDWFGWSVAIGGNTAIVGAWQDNDNGIASGSAYLFEISDPANPTQLLKLLADDGEAFDNFGKSVAVSGTIAIIGARYDDDNGSSAGAAYLFDSRIDVGGAQTAKLLADDGTANDWFGFSVAIGGPTAIVGALKDNDNGNHSGSAYLFDTTTGEQLFKLLPSDGDVNDEFGFAVAIDGTTAIVGAHFDDDNGPFSGSAYLFDISDPANPIQLFKLLADDGAEEDGFGTSVAISGATAIVGAYKHDNNRIDSGAAYLFDTATGRQIAKLLPDDGAAFDGFGVSVAINATTAVIGASHNDDSGGDSGSAYLFDISDPANPTQLIKLLAEDGAANDNFGWSVAISDIPGNETAIVGAYRTNDHGFNSGSAYLFDALTTSVCPWDFGGNGVVDAADLATLLGSWGPCSGCPADFNGDGVINAIDLALLLRNWGPCR